MFSQQSNPFLNCCWCQRRACLSSTRQLVLWSPSAQCISLLSLLVRAISIIRLWTSPRDRNSFHLYIWRANERPLMNVLWGYYWRSTICVPHLQLGKQHKCEYYFVKHVYWGKIAVVLFFTEQKWQFHQIQPSLKVNSVSIEVISS